MSGTLYHHDGFARLHSASCWQQATDGMWQVSFGLLSIPLTSILGVVSRLSCVPCWMQLCPCCPAITGVQHCCPGVSAEQSPAG